MYIKVIIKVITRFPKKNYPSKNATKLKQLFSFLLQRT